MTKVAVLDDWQDKARELADWSPLTRRADVSFFSEAFTSADEMAKTLAPFDIVLSMRERSAMPAALFDRLPNLRMLGITGARAASIDIDAARTRGIVVCNTGAAATAPYTGSAATAEVALGLMIAAVRRIPLGDAEIRAGRFQRNVPQGFMLAGRTLGVIGLGRIGSMMARYGQALGMEVIAWSQNLTAERAKETGATLVGKEALLSRADVVSLHLVLSDRTRGIIGAVDLARMKPGAVLVNTSRGPLVDEAALLAALQSGRLLAGLDVYDREPLPEAHPLRTAPNCVLTPHIGYVVREGMADFYKQSIENALAFLDGKPVRVMTGNS
ncbi:MAG: D-2-hydroxyacid dehydrogenase family protein [Acetobacteraceae bacterium]|nr:D-2-hydroxyacid dehydrogenase family protein [Acetobacteraceae bacterium]